MKVAEKVPARSVASPHEVDFAPTQEIRFATVMYGGVSLAVYMNGISQELLHAVRATAGRPDNPTAAGRARFRNGKALEPRPQGTEAVYRELAQALYHGRKPGTPLGGYEKQPIRTRIVVDLLAGTSAGGINAVYLAKALVNNVSLDPLKDMWLEDADIDTLLNDNGSAPGKYPPTQPLTSLLNSTRMYGLLLSAFEKMDAEKDRKQEENSGKELPSLVDDLDLFVTTTDLNGVVAPIQLADMTVQERIYKASFHFVHGRALASNDFTSADNPMLAFSARCTSSFPVAFEPMKITNLDLLDGRLADQLRSDRFRKFFALFETNDDDLPYPRRPFADGGYLNNKPFSFVIDEIPSRTSDVPVRRKLLYLDPSPETAKNLANVHQNVDFTQNLLDAASTLPREQTIREDIERLNEYNRGIHAAQALAAEIEEDDDSLSECLKKSKLVTTPYPKRTLKDMQRQYGTCYATYHHLRVAAVTTDLAQLVTRLMFGSDCSDYLYAIRMLIVAWRKDKYSPNSMERPENYFLFQYDIGFRYRRADYVRSCIDKVLGALASPDARSLERALEGASENVANDANQLRTQSEEARGQLYLWRDKMEDIKRALSYGRQKFLLASRGHKLEGDADQHLNSQGDEMRELLEETGLSERELRDVILRPVLDADCQAKANEIYHDPTRPLVKKNIGEAAEVLATWFEGLMKETDPDLPGKMRGYADVKDPVARIVQRYVATHFDYFDCRDMQIFTAVQDQLAGEGVEVEIYRVSPLDATLLRTDSDRAGADKLAGTALFAFGAFLSREWRENDMLWGRLDAAERIISALLPDPEDEPWRREFCEKAFSAILHEAFSLHGGADLMRQLIAYLKNKLKESNVEAKTPEEFLRQSIRVAGNCPSPLIRQLLQAIANDADRLAMFKAYYVKPPEPPPPESLQRLRRALRIFTAMLKGLDGGEGAPSKVVGRAANFAAAVTRFAEFSVPQTLPQAFLRYWLQALYTIGAVLVATGAFFSENTETAGWTVLLISAALQIASSLIGRGLRGKKIRERIVAVVAIAAIVCTAAALALINYHCYLPREAWKAPLYFVRAGITDKWQKDYCAGWGQYR